MAAPPSGKVTVVRWARPPRGWPRRGWGHPGWREPWEGVAGPMRGLARACPTCGAAGSSYGARDHSSARGRSRPRAGLALTGDLGSRPSGGTRAMPGACRSCCRPSSPPGCVERQPRCKKRPLSGGGGQSWDRGLVSSEQALRPGWGNEACPVYVAACPGGARRRS